MPVKDKERTTTAKAAQITPSRDDVWDAIHTIGNATIQVPNLGNATPHFLTDELGYVQSAIKRLEKLEGLYKEALKAKTKLPTQPGEKVVVDGTLHQATF